VTLLHSAAIHGMDTRIFCSLSLPSAARLCLVSCSRSLLLSGSFALC
jgi:hypothetical protein